MRAALFSLLSQLPNQTKPNKQKTNYIWQTQLDKNKTTARLPLPFMLAPKMMLVEANQMDKFLNR